mmetsp:Transcript_28186/g.32615  ORF Transcript_28186/g.32615 Transcript_28186/m.32615 type:complete len:95 (-) Transcript_28186:372-656(-)|eukprot:CAMPEP_0176446916 /NCGR_PEP_ID=MMETSP0127-20121128/24663_1 /TAXON_ID=938130 /ORGANISM="Platyophrya macrostoma, Strain WH" /LENGTH=94 /DNA_ID=CAMNT_0017833147 /DNA_START=28 /DNA_END=312 /DNA_ORIENTATION=+
MEITKARELLRNKSKLRELAQAAFDRMDTAKNGWITKEDLQVAMGAYLLTQGKPAYSYDIEAQFRELCTNSDGKVFFSDYYAATKESLRKKCAE